MNPRLTRSLIAFAALLLAVATGLGAVASHGLGNVLDPDALRSFSTGVDYQFVHALGLLGLSIYGERQPAMRLLAAASLLIVAGIVLFCGGVYASSLGGPGWIAGLAPAGGVCLIVGWLVAAIAVLASLGSAGPTGAGAKRKSKSVDGSAAAEPR